MARPRVELLHPGMAELLKAPGVAALLQSLADRVASNARASAPVDTGAHRNSIHVEMVTTDRITARVVANTDHSLLVESRTGHMARALGAARGH